LQPRIPSLALALAIGLVPIGASAQELSDRDPRLAANLALGIAGELDAHVAQGSSSTRFQGDLDPSVGFDLRGELPVLDFLVIGAWFEFLSVEGESSGSEREESFAFDGYVRARWVFEALTDVLFIEPYLLLPLGFSMAILDLDDDGDDVWPGWNTAVLLGAQFLHASGFGGYLELGWRHAEVYRSESVALVGDVTTSLILNEMALAFGVVYAFGG